MRHTLGTAAKATGKSRTTILRAIEKGKISAKKDDHGQWNIDPAELHRVYPLKYQDNNVGNSSAATAANNDLLLEITALKAKLEGMGEREKVKDEIIEDLRHDRDHWRQQATALLTDQREKAPQKPKQGFGARLLYVLTGKE